MQDNVCLNSITQLIDYSKTAYSHDVDPQKALSKLFYYNAATTVSESDKEILGGIYLQWCMSTKGTDRERLIEVMFTAINEADGYIDYSMEFSGKPLTQALMRPSLQLAYIKSRPWYIVYVISLIHTT